MGRQKDLIHRAELTVDGQSVPLKIYAERRANARASIVKSGVIIRLPVLLNRHEAQEHIEQFKRWAVQQFRQKPQLFHHPRFRDYPDGQQLQVGRCAYLVRLHEIAGHNSKARLKDGVLELSLGRELELHRRREHTQKLVSKVVGQHQLPRIREKIMRLNDIHFQEKINHIRIKHNISNWGSCSRKRNINISSRLLFAPEAVIDYVCLHELAHLVQPNHSIRFWRLVARAMPDFREKERWLKAHGGECYF